METNKYYTPTTEEFHKGFEFEWFQNNFEKEIFSITTDDDLEIIDDEIREGKIRVKLLDREDIESLGWELDSCVEQECFYLHISSNLHNGDIRLIFREKENSIEINACRFGECFYGILKNKSELKKLMNQLNIK